MRGASAAPSAIATAITSPPNGGSFSIDGLVHGIRAHKQCRHALAPTQSEPLFVIAQLAVLGIFTGLGSLAASRFRSEAAQAA